MIVSLPVLMYVHAGVCWTDIKSRLTVKEYRYEESIYHTDRIHS
jgi:hypothetical protein